MVSHRQSSTMRKPGLEENDCLMPSKSKVMLENFDPLNTTDIESAAKNT